MSKQTAVEWLVNALVKHDRTFREFYGAEIEQAKEMEREQIIIAFCEGYDHDGESYDDAETSYYNRTYKGGEQ